MYRAFVQPADGNRVSIPPDELHHLIRVRRSQEGDLFLGYLPQRGWQLCRLKREGGRWCGEVIEPVSANWESPLRITLGQALIKKDRFEWVIQKAVELGVGEIVPLVTHRSELKLDRNLEKRLQRWQKILRESMKQCGRNLVPDLRQPEPLASFLASDLPPVRIALDEAASQPLCGHLEKTPKPAQCVLLVGPEGGWDDRDRACLSQAGCASVRLGPRILRAETAPIACLAILQSEWGDLG